MPDSEGQDVKWLNLGKYGTASDLSSCLGIPTEKEPLISVPTLFGE